MPGSREVKRGESCSGDHDRRRTSRRAGVLGGAVLVLVLVLGASLLLPGRAGPGVSPPSVASLAVGTPAPDFAVDSLEGGRLALSGLRGRAVWLTFWASWCGPCRAEMPELLAASEDARGRGVRLVAIDIGEEPDVVKTYLARGGYTELPAALDRSGAVSRAYGVYGLPTHVFIDARGIVRGVRTGMMSAAEMRGAIEELE